MIYALMLENKERMDAIAPMESVYRIPVPLEVCLILRLRGS
jgi:hypothetical protein